MKQFAKLLVSLVLIVLASLTSQAQGVNDAFYIYQNDGHFNGFFFDEVKEIRYSKLDTLNNEHSDYVSQEIVTADSTYRIMLAAIDSVGFVQPEIIYNPQLRDMVAEGMDKAFFNWDRSSSTINFWEDNLTDANKPRVGDILLYNIGEVFCAKVTSVQSDGMMFYTVETEPVSDVKDVYQQFITIEEYSHDRNGRLAGRRVAGMPELNSGRFVKPRRAIGQFEGDIFDFNLGGHIPLSDAIALDVNIEGGINVKASWHLPLIGTSYIGITTTFNAGVGMGISINGTIAEPIKGKLSENATIPLPASVPMFELVLAPDCFLRGSVTAKASVATPKAKGKVWSKLEFIDYIPYLEMGFGNPPGTTEEEAAAEEEADYYDNVSSATLEFSGFVQTGMMFPLSLRTNKWLSKVLNCEVGTTLYVGPKLGASLSVDIENRMMGDDSFYSEHKGTKFTLSPFDADFETKATFKSFWGEENEQTLADGTFNILPNLDLYLFPDFVDWVETDEEISITPARNILFPTRVGLRLYKEESPGNYTQVNDYWNENIKYYQLYGAWRDGNAKLSLSKKNEEITAGNKYKIYPIFSFLGATIQGNQWYEFEIIPKTYFTNVPSDPVVFSPNGETKTLCNIAGTLDNSVVIEASNPNIKINGRVVSMTRPKLYGIHNIDEWVHLTARDASTGNIISESKPIHIKQKPTYELKDVEVSGTNIFIRHSTGSNSIKDGKLVVSGIANNEMTQEKCSFNISVNFIDAEDNEDKRWGTGSYTETYVHNVNKEIEGEFGPVIIQVEETNIYELALTPDGDYYAQHLATFLGQGTMRTIQRYEGKIILDKTDDDRKMITLTLIPE